jgi:hypothetical protein
MGNPGAFKGKQLEYLISTKPDYAQAVSEEKADDWLLNEFRKFFLRFDPDKGEHYQPTDEELASVDDSQPAREIQPPDQESMLPEEYEEKREYWLKMQAWVKVRKDVRGGDSNRRASPDLNFSKLNDGINISIERSAASRSLHHPLLLISRFRHEGPRIAVAGRPPQSFLLHLSATHRKCA